MSTPPGIVFQTLLTVFSIVLTAIIGIIVKRMNDHNEERRRDEQRREDEAQETERKRSDEYAAIRNGICAILRDRILRADVHFTTLGCATAAEKSNIQMMFNAYHTLGGNDIATASYKRIMQLPFPAEEHA